MRGVVVELAKGLPINKEANSGPRRSLDREEESVNGPVSLTSTEQMNESQCLNGVFLQVKE